MVRDDIYPVRKSKVGCHCSGIRPWTFLLDIYHPDTLHAPVAATTVLVLLMMDAESVRNMYIDLAVTNKQYCQSCFLLLLYISTTHSSPEKRGLLFQYQERHYATYKALKLYNFTGWLRQGSLWNIGTRYKEETKTYTICTTNVFLPVASVDWVVCDTGLKIRRPVCIREVSRAIEHNLLVLCVKTRVVSIFWHISPFCIDFIFFFFQ